MNAAAGVTAELSAAVHALVIADRGDAATAAQRAVSELAPLLSPTARAEVVRRVVDRVHGLGALEALLGDPTVTEVLVNRGREVWIERAGRLEHLDVELALGEAEHLVERMLAPLGVRADRTNPVADARLPDGSRLHIVMPPVAPDGLCLSIRRFAARPIALDAFGGSTVVAVLCAAVEARLNVVVSGATSSGKTTLLNALAALVDSNERIVTIEDACELRIAGRHVVRLEARRATADGLGAVTIGHLVRAALRMRPDRLVVGEVRGAEALDMVQAMSTGHDGSLATCHANDALDALRRIEVMILHGGGPVPLDALRAQLHSSVDLVVHVGRDRGGRRRVHAIAEVSLDPVDGRRVLPIVVDGEIVAVPRRPARLAAGGRWLP